MKNNKVSWWVLSVGDPRNFHNRFFVKNYYLNLSISGGQERIDLVGKRPKSEQYEITSEFKTSNNYSIKCINERLGSLLPGSEDWGSWRKL